MTRLRRTSRFHLSLRSAFVFTSILCFVLALWVHRAERQQAVVTWVVENNGYVIYEYQSKGGYDPNASPPLPYWLIDLAGIDYFSRIDTVLFLPGEMIEDLSPLYDLKHFRCLILEDTNVSVEQLESIKNELPQLQIVR